MTDLNLDAAARVEDAILATGADVTDFEVRHREPRDVSEGMATVFGGDRPTQFVFTVEPGRLDADDPERADDASDGADDIVDFLAEYVEATESFEGVEPELDPEDHVRAALGQMDSIDDVDRLWSAVQFARDD